MNSPVSVTTRRIIELACRAPSVHNSQPWLWRVVDDATIELYADRSRQLPVSDSSGRNLAVSCGAALHHAVVAARALGLAPTVELEPPADDDNLLARLALSPGARSSGFTDSLAALEARCTDRRRFTSWPIPQDRLALLVKSASVRGAHALLVADPTKRFRAEQLLQQAMAAQAADARFIDEQRTWTEHTPVSGIPLAGAVPISRLRPATRANRFASVAEAATIEAAADDRMVEGSDSLIAVCTAADDQGAWLQAGQTLSALWLRATHDGLSMVPLSQVVEVPQTRSALRRDVFDDMAQPQVLVRVGWLETSRGPLERTTRRPFEDVTWRAS